MDVLDRLRTLAAHELTIDASALVPTTPLSELHIDSLAFVDFLFKVEGEFNIRVPDERVTTLRTIGDLEQMITELLAATPQG
jgi:acyl carrier protein